jgi:cytochrome c oxidase cbb3-type subunit 4
MTYETAAQFAQQAGTIYFGLLFLAGSAYGLWPRNKETFQRAARLPLEDESL